MEIANFAPTKPKASIWTKVVAGINLAIGVLALILTLYLFLVLPLQISLLYTTLIFTLAHLVIFFSLSNHSKKLLALSLFVNLLVLILYLVITYSLWDILTSPITPRCNKDIVVSGQLHEFCPNVGPSPNPNLLGTIFFTVLAVFSFLSLLSVWKNLRKFRVNKTV